MSEKYYFEVKPDSSTTKVCKNVESSSGSKAYLAKIEIPDNSKPYLSLPFDFASNLLNLNPRDKELVSFNNTNSTLFHKLLDESETLPYGEKEFANATASRILTSGSSPISNKKILDYTTGLRYLSIALIISKWLAEVLIVNDSSSKILIRVEPTSNSIQIRSNYFNSIYIDIDYNKMKMSDAIEVNLLFYKSPNGTTQGLYSAAAVAYGGGITNDNYRKDWTQLENLTLDIEESMELYYSTSSGVGYYYASAVDSIQYF